MQILSLFGIHFIHLLTHKPRRASPSYKIADCELSNSYILTRKIFSSNRQSYIAQVRVNGSYKIKIEKVKIQGFAPKPCKPQRASPSYKKNDYSKIFYVLEDRNSIARNRQFYNLVKRVGV